MTPRSRTFRPMKKPHRSLGLRLQPLHRTRPRRYPNDRPKMLRGTVRPHGAVQRPRRGKARRHPARHLHPPPRRRERSLRRRRHRLPILMRDTTCSRWPITTWKACDRTPPRATGITRRNCRRAEKYRSSGKDGPIAPRALRVVGAPRGRSGTPRENQTNARGSVYRAQIACPDLFDLGVRSAGIIRQSAGSDLERSCE